MHRRLMANHRRPSLALGRLTKEHPMGRIPASERTREKLKVLMGGTQETGELGSELVRLAARLILEEALEGEAEDALGRGYYMRGALPGAGYRNGYRTGRLKTAEGAVEYSAPQIADRAEPFRSKIRAILGNRTDELEALAVEMYARGLSTRDIEAVFADETGKSLLSRSAVSAVTERLWVEYEAFAGRDLAEFDVVYLFVDGIAERLHLGRSREAVLAAWGILADGKKALLHLAPGTKEDTASCREFFHDLGRRGLPDPLLVVSDGAAGVIRAIEECFPRSMRQRCLAHKIRNLQSKVPEDVWPEFKARAAACYQAASPVLARLLRDDIAATYEADLPSAVACLDDDFEACIAHLRFPLAHRRAIRTTNLLERLFGEERRRTKVIPHAFGERALLKLMYAALIRAAERWRGLRMTEFDMRQLKAIRDELNRDFAARVAPATGTTPTASQNRLSSKNRT
jgi:transposase-like protein